jgi:hypothetical protein
MTLQTAESAPSQKSSVSGCYNQPGSVVFDQNHVVGLDRPLLLESHITGREDRLGRMHNTVSGL